MTSNRNGEVRGRPTVVIGANDRATLAGMRMALEADDLCVCAEVTSTEELVSAVKTFDPDVCLVDVDLDGEGIRAAAAVVSAATGVALVLLADDPVEEEFLDAMRFGAVGYVPKSISPARLPKIIRAVLQGEPAVPRALVVSLITEYRARQARRHVPIPHGRGVDLTSREWEVLDFMRQGLSTRQIAARLLISEVTVRRHISSVLKKLHVATREDALKLLQSA